MGPFSTEKRGLQKFDELEMESAASQRAGACPSFHRLESLCADEDVLGAERAISFAFSAVGSAERTTKSATCPLGVSRTTTRRGRRGRCRGNTREAPPGA